MHSFCCLMKITDMEDVPDLVYYVQALDDAWISNWYTKNKRNSSA